MSTPTQSLDEHESAGLNLTRLRLLSIVAPAAFVGAVITATAIFAEDVSLPLLIAAGILSVTAAGALFSSIVFHLIERSEAGLMERNEQLAAVQSAASSIAAEFDLHSLLERFVERSREITGARYGAMSVLGSDGQIVEFITSGLSDDERAAIGHPPVGRGLLGLIIAEGRALRLEDMSKHASSAGFPPHHPPMSSLLGVPVISRGTPIGNLYLTDKLESPSFTEADEEMVRTFAAHAAIAIETSRLHDELRLLAVLRERERIGMDLHDGIIQSIYAVALGLESAVADVGEDPETARDALNTSIDRLNVVIRDVRSYIFELRPAKLSFDLSESLTRMVQEFKANATVDVEIDIAPALPELNDAQRTAIFHITQEALVNGHKHAHARHMRVALQPRLRSIYLSISDDGDGFDTAARFTQDHHGLRNMTARANAAGGALSINSAPGSGTSVEVELPLAVAPSEAEGALT